MLELHAFFLIILFVGSIYVSVILGEGLIRTETIVFYTVIFLGYSFTLFYIWNREKQIELEQLEIERRMALEEAKKYKEDLERIKMEFEEFTRKIQNSQLKIGMGKFHLPFLLMILGVFISSCSPRYEVVYLYHTPKTTEGSKCIEKCKIGKINCNNRCIKERNKCYKEAVELAKKIYEAKLREYKIEYRNYLNLYKNYKGELWEWERRKAELENNYAYFSSLCSTEQQFCSERDFYYNLLKNLKYKEPVAPKKPIKPDFSKIVEEQKRSLCNLNCNCTDEFNICFQNCGGEIEIKKMCVENCD